ncbi:MAG TPA: DNA polymerase IV [Gemmatimonadaceae bacterium]|nr:DNA polymerase IV [Gemmatimonadaceae bacterium]
MRQPLPVSTREPRILLADADAFFVAVARLVDPEGAGKAQLLIVGGRPGSRGVVCSASYEARAFGVRSGMSISQALRLCPAAMAVPVPRHACGDKSHAIRQVLTRFAPVVVAASVDEFYLDMTGTEALYHGEPLEVTAQRIRAAVVAETGCSISIGGGTSTLIAKIAAGAAKPIPGSGATGVHIVPAGAEEAFMRTQPLSEIPGIGPKAQERLRALGLVRVPDVLDAEPATMRRYLGDKLSEWITRKARGIGASTLHGRDQQKAMSREDTFDHDISDDALLETELQRLAVRVVADLRGDGLRARTITVKLRDNDFTTRNASRTLDVPVSTERAVFATARLLFRKLRTQRRLPVRLLGVALSQLDDGDLAEQLSLLPGDVPVATETPRDRALAAAVDRVRARFGAGAVQSASLLGDAAPTSVEDRSETDGPRRQPSARR